MSIVRPSSSAAAVHRLRDYKASLTNGKIRERLVCAFGSAQLREGAMSTGGQVGVLSRIWVLTPATFAVLVLHGGFAQQDGPEAQDGEVNHDLKSIHRFRFCTKHPLSSH